MDVCIWLKYWSNKKNIIHSFGCGALIGKTDIKDAFCIIPIHSS